MTQRKKKKPGRVRRGGRKHKRRSRSVNHVVRWKRQLSALKAKAKATPGVSMDVTMRGWELQLRYSPGLKHQWSLVAKPWSGTPDWRWLSRAADYVGIPDYDEDGISQRPGHDDGLAMVSWTWEVRQAALPNHNTEADPTGSAAGNAPPRGPE